MLYAVAVLAVGLQGCGCSGTATELDDGGRQSMDGGDERDAGPVDAGPLTCLTRGCDAGAFCDPLAGVCLTATGPSTRFRARTLWGHMFDGVNLAVDSFGAAGIGECVDLVVTPAGDTLYCPSATSTTYVYSSLARIDVATGAASTLSGIDWPGEASGPADQSQYLIDFYQQGGIALSPDGHTLYVTSSTLREVDTTTGASKSLTVPGAAKLRALAVGASGTLYLLGWDGFVARFADGGVSPRPVTFPAPLPPPGYIVVDEARGWAYGLDRNYKSGTFTRWPLDGGVAEWLNFATTGTRDKQYTSDGPVSAMELANPAGITIDAAGVVYLGAGDGLTFRRYQPDTQLVDSLCTLPDAGPDDFEWCVSDGVRTKAFGTWPSFLVFDRSGNGYFGFSVYPRVVQLRRLP